MKQTNKRIRSAEDTFQGHARSAARWKQMWATENRPKKKKKFQKKRKEKLHN